MTIEWEKNRTHTHSFDIISTEANIVSRNHVENRIIKMQKNHNKLKECENSRDLIASITLILYNFARLIRTKRESDWLIGQW